MRTTQVLASCSQQVHAARNGGLSKRTNLHNTKRKGTKIKLSKSNRTGELWSF